jgi:hypothetical protein
VAHESARQRPLGLACVSSATSPAEHGSTTLLLALEHARGSPRVKIVFQGNELGIFDLNGPTSLAELRLVPDGDRLVGFAWMGTQPEPVEFVRAGGKRVRVLRVPGNDGVLEYERTD